MRGGVRAQAETLAANLVHRLKPEVHSSARETLLLLARGFTDRPVDVQFTQAMPVQSAIEFSAPPH